MYIASTCYTHKSKEALTQIFEKSRCILDQKWQTKITFEIDLAESWYQSIALQLRMRCGDFSEFHPSPIR
jgi:hypothetical protein